MPTYEVAPYEVSRIVFDLANEFHRGFRKLKISVLLATSGVRLTPIEAKITSPYHRATGASDVAIVISDAAWRRRNDAQRRAMIDHALCSIQVVELNGNLSTDSAGRPRIRRIPRDCSVGYMEPWRRWKNDSIEAQSLAKLKSVAGDLAS